MGIEAVSFRPYIYNTNMLSGRSLSKVPAIGDDLLAGKTDFSSLADESLDENPLGRGQSANFADILGMQMQMGRLRASRVMKPGFGMGEPKRQDAAYNQPVKPAGAKDNVPADDGMHGEPLAASDYAEGFKPARGAWETQDIQSGRNLYQMRKAAEAYQMFAFA